MQTTALTSDQLDTLREVANIGAGHAATALSHMTGRHIRMSIPLVVGLPTDQLPASVAEGDGGRIVAVRTHIRGDLAGDTVLTLSAANARRLCDALLFRTTPDGDQFDDLERSTIMETGNILAGAYLNALAALLHLVLLPSVPELLVASMEGYAASWRRRTNGLALCAATEFAIPEESGDVVLRGTLLHLPDVASLRTILDTLAVR
jgi:chemotaxis protein CheC